MLRLTGEKEPERLKYMSLGRCPGLRDNVSKCRNHSYVWKTKARFDVFTQSLQHGSFPTPGLEVFQCRGWKISNAGIGGSPIPGLKVLLTRHGKLSLIYAETTARSYSNVYELGFTPMSRYLKKYRTVGRSIRYVQSYTVAYATILQTKQ